MLVALKERYPVGAPPIISIVEFIIKCLFELFDNGCIIKGND
jgi:hypothetical protein